MVDVSHASDDVFFDAIAISEAPIIATHSNARTVTEHDRNMSDERMLRLMAENGGVVQLTLLSEVICAMTPKSRKIGGASRTAIINEECKQHDPRGACRATLSLQ